MGSERSERGPCAEKHGAAALWPNLVGLFGIMFIGVVCVGCSFNHNEMLLFSTSFNL